MQIHIRVWNYNKMDEGVGDDGEDDDGDDVNSCRALQYLSYGWDECPPVDS
jgi:hypothetical protein